MKLIKNRIDQFCIFLAVAAFLLDIYIPWAIGSILYIGVILLCVKSSKMFQIFKFALLVSGFLMIAFLITHPAGNFWRILTNYALVLGMIWITAIAVYQFKKAQESASRLMSIVSFSDDAIWTLSLEGEIISWNKSAHELFCFSDREIFLKKVYKIIHEKHVKEFEDIFTQVIAGKNVDPREFVFVAKNGHEVDVSISISPVYDSFNFVVGASVIARNITRQKEAERKEKELNEIIFLEKKKIEEVLNLDEGLHSIFNFNKLVDFIVKQTASIMDAQRCSLIIVDDESKEMVLKANIGLSEDIIKGLEIRLGESISGIVAQEGQPMLVKDIELHEKLCRKKMASYKSNSFISVPIKLEDRLLGVLNVADKVSLEGDFFNDLDLKIMCMIARQVAVALEASKMYRELKFLTVTDPLTGIYNFRHLANTLDHEIARAKRYSGPLCLLMIDVDDFKQYNDTFGHLEGDVLLKKISKVFNETVREIDTVCRYAGDEFMIIFPDTDVKSAQMVAEKIRKKTESIDGKKSVTISIGVAKYHEKMDRYEFIQKADSALYHSKKNGKNNVFVNA